MKSSVRAGAPERVKTDLLVVATTEAAKRPASLAALDETVGGAIARAMQAGDFTGEASETMLLYPDGPAARLLLVGVGKVPTTQEIRRAASIAARRAPALGARSLAWYATPEARANLDPADVARAAVEGAGQGGWVFENFRSKRGSKSELDAVVVVADSADRAAMEKGRVVGAAVAAGQHFARNLQMRPGNHCTPADIASEARKIGRAHEMKVTVLRRTQMEREGLNAHLAVAQGSAEEPRLVIVEYRNGGNAPPICLVGKGVTFDSGGISLKPPLNMEEMKFDMSGGAAVLGAMEAIGRLQPRINVVGIVPATENLPSSTAVKPGDVVTTHLGKTVEIINTDAEGRLILCDALSYAQRYRPACIVDIATLTGAVVIALGDQASGLMGNDEDLVQELRDVGDAVGEPCWPLPLWEGYRQQIKSDTADIKNTGGRPAGSITAGWFLKEFTEGQRWAHLDIAGTAYIDRDRPELPKGPTGVGVRLFTEFVLRRAG